MRKIISFLIFCLLIISPARAEFSLRLDYIDGSIERVYETRAGEWTAFVLVKDSLGKSFKCFVHSDQTLIKKGPQILPLSELNAGTKVIVLARKQPSGDFRTSVIQIKDPILR